jgi:hypothetical protein
MRPLLLGIATAAALVLAAAGSATHNTDDHSANMQLAATFPYASGTDLAFWNDVAVAGNQSPGGFRLLKLGDASVQQIGQFSCPGAQSDVSIWKTLVFVSIDTPNRENCTSGPNVEGIRVVDVGSLESPNPQQVTFVQTDCGSHTHTLLPDLANDRVLIYVSSFLLGVPTATCNVHAKISVVEVPLDRPQDARVISTPSVASAEGCHDITVYPAIGLAGAACITESQLWDISDPVNPRVISHIVNPLINIHHSATFSFDGRTLALGDELGGAAVAPGCLDGNQHVPIGAIWFYDVSNPLVPVLRGTFHIPQDVTATVCTAHNYNIVPVKSGRDLLVSGWYRGGTTIVDFTDPSNPTQVGYYIAAGPPASNSWSSYWYRDRIYANNLGTRGFDAFVVTDPLVKDAIRLHHLNPQTMETGR